MNFIEKIILVNFQSHVYSELSLSRGVNVIVGPSDSGKTAIMRALRWNMFNDPSGVEFVREGESEVSVTVRFQNNVEVERRRSRSKNQYILRRPDEEELVFEGFGKNVPAEIEEAIGIKKIMLDDKKALPLNFSDQLDGPFLLQETDAYKAQAIGRMVGVDLLDETMRDTLRDKKQISIRRELMEKDLEETEQSLVAFSDLDDQIAFRERIEKLLSSVSELKKKTETAKTFVHALKEIREDRALTKDVVSRYAVLNELQDKLVHLQRNVDHYRNERLLFDLYMQNRQGRRETKDQLSLYEKVDALEKNLTQLSAIKATYDGILPHFNRLRTIREAEKNNQIVLEETKGVFALDAMDLREKYAAFCDYSRTLDAFKELKLRMEKGKLFLSRFDQLDRLAELNVEITEMMEKERSVEALKNDQRRLKDEKNKTAVELKQLIEGDRQAMNAYLECLSHAGTCPLCKQTIDDEALHAIKHSLED